MNIRFLLFRGQWEDEGNFLALENPESIIILATGKTHSKILTESLGLDYLKENKVKIKAILVLNTALKNVGFLENIYQELNMDIPLYGSLSSKLVLEYLFPQFLKLKKNYLIVKTEQELKITGFSLVFFTLNSYSLGNLGIKISYENLDFYYLGNFMFSSLTNNPLLFSSLVFPPVDKKTNTYLITDFQNLCWSNSNNSLFWEARLFIDQSKDFIFLLYDFDWLHIFELLEFAKQQKVKVKVLNNSFNLLLKKVLDNNSLSSVLASGKEEKVIYLLVVNSENAEKAIPFYWENFLQKKLNLPVFVVGIPPMSGGLESLARTVDYLHNQRGEVIDLSRSNHLSLGTSLDDLKLLWEIIQPRVTISLQNSYKHSKYFNYFSLPFIRLNNQQYLSFPAEKVYPLRIKKKITNIEQILVSQRQSLLKSGLLIIFLITQWKDKLFQIKKIRIENLAVSLEVNLPKLENKIKDWWKDKITPGLSEKESSKSLKSRIEKRLSFLIKNYINYKHKIDLEEPLILMFQG